MTVMIGDHDKWSQEDGERRMSGTVVKNKQYSQVVMGWDVALVMLDKEIRFSAYGGRVGPVCLAKQGSGYYNNNKAIAMGWGATSEGGEKVYRYVQT